MIIHFYNGFKRTNGQEKSKMSQKHQNITSISNIFFNNVFQQFSDLLNVFVKYDVAIILNELARGIRAI